MATRVKNGKKTAGVKERAVNFYVRGGMTKEAAQKRVNAEYRTVSARARNYRKITGSKTTNEQIYSKFIKFGAKDDTVREILKVPTTNPKITKEQAGGDIERYSKKTIQTAAYYSANVWLNSFTISIQTAGKGSNLRRIWEKFTYETVVTPAEKKAERILRAEKTKAEEKEAAEEAAEIIEEAKKSETKFWQAFDRIPRGLVAADQAFPKDWKITDKGLKTLVADLKRWAKDYENANKGGGGAGVDGGHVHPVTGS